MFKKLVSWFKSVFTKKVATKVRQTIIVTASEAVNGFVNDPANQVAAREAVFAVAEDSPDATEGGRREPAPLATDFAWRGGRTRRGKLARWHSRRRALRSQWTAKRGCE